MFGIGPTELIVLLVIALIVVGPERLPQMAGQIGKAIRDFRQMSGDVTGEFQRAFQLDEPPPTEPIATFPSAVPDALDNGAPALSAQVIPFEPPLAEPSATEESAAAAGPAAAGAPPTPTDYSTLATPPLATKDDPLAGVSMLDEPEPPPATTTYESQAVADLTPYPSQVASATVATNSIADAWDAVMTTDATLSLPEPTAEELQPALIGTAVALAEREEATDEAASLTEAQESRARVDPDAEPSIREVIEAQVAAEAFRERRRVATYRRHK